MNPAEDARRGSGRKMAVIVMDGAEPIYAGFADPKEVETIIKMLEEKTKKIPRQ